MARDFSRRFYCSKAWRNTRDAYMRAVVDVDGRPCPAGMCERCFKLGFLVPAEIVHHREHLSPLNINDPSVSMSFGNLERLCRKCHADEHPEIYGERRGCRVAFDSEGNVVRK